MNNGKRFDVCLMNPPYSGGTRLGDGFYIDFINKCVYISNNTVSVNPLNGLVTHVAGGALKNKTGQLHRYIDIIKPDIEIVNKTVFDAGIKGDICIVNFNKFADHKDIAVYKNGKTYKFSRQSDISLNDNEYLNSFAKSLYKFMCPNNIIEGYINLKNNKIISNENEITIIDNIHNHLYATPNSEPCKHNNKKLPDVNKKFICLYKINASFANITYSNCEEHPIEYNEKLFSKSLNYLEISNMEIGNRICKYLNSDFAKMILKMAGNYFHPYLKYDFIPWLDFQKSYMEKELFNMIGMEYDKEEIGKILND